MRFSNLLLTAVAFTGAVNALVEFTNASINNVTAGQPFTLTWTKATGPVTIKLKNGDPRKLDDVQTLVSGATGNSFTWNVPATLAADTYAFEISDGGPKPNYSGQFQLIGGVTKTTSASSTASANSTTTSVSSSATTTDESSTTTTRSSTRSSGTQSGTTSTPSSTSAPAGGMAAGFTSNLAFVFLVAGALMTLN